LAISKTDICLLAFVTNYYLGFILKTIVADEFADLLLSKRPLLDVRAEIEFSKGAFPGACNLPILTDSERQKVGRCYKIKGQQAAIELGHQIVSGEVKQQRLQQWSDFMAAHPEAVLYCFRGGMRSKITQQWLFDAGLKIPRVEGGYKALRNFLLNVIEEHSKADNLIVIGGRTGTGKTRVVHQLESSLDLEGLANHRGSAFGKQPTPQPAQINFENNIGIEFLRLKNLKIKTIAIEDESKLIGKNALPICLKKALADAELVVVNEPIESRIQVVIDEYVTDLISQFQRLHPTLEYHEVFDIYQNSMYSSLLKIQKRIGNTRHSELLKLMQYAMQQQLKKDDDSHHAAWIKPLLCEYYDKMYDYQLEQKKRQIIFQGNREQVIAFLKKK